MKRIHLFEFEDLAWFPDWLRKCLTRIMMVLHKLLNTSEEMADLVNRALKYTDNNTIIDLCSGSGGPMPEVLEILKKKFHVPEPRLIMTDLFPDREYAAQFNTDKNEEIIYLTDKVDAARIDADLTGLRTMVGSLHHMKPEDARKILKNTMDSIQPFLAFEISDNSFRRALWWVVIPVNILSALAVSLLARPFTWQQFVFTYLIPIIPIVYAWDGAVSNARTYTLQDMDILLAGLDSEEYLWDKGVLNGRSNKLYLMGLPENKKTPS